MRVTYFSPQFGHCGGPDNPSTEELEPGEIIEINVPTCGWCEFEVVPGVFVKVEVSEWGSVVVKGSNVVRNSSAND